MTVAELIAELEKLDPELRVLVDGYEGGQDDPILEQHTAYVHPEAGGFFGDYTLEPGLWRPDSETAFEAVVLHRPGGVD